MAFTKLDPRARETAIEAIEAKAESWVSRHGTAGAIVVLAIALAGASYGISQSWLSAHMQAKHRHDAVSNLVPAVSGSTVSVPPQTALVPAQMGLFFRDSSSQGWSVEPFQVPAEGPWSVTLDPAPPSGSWVRLYVEDTDGLDYYGPWFRMP